VRPRVGEVSSAHPHHDCLLAIPNATKALQSRIGFLLPTPIPQESSGTDAFRQGNASPTSG
jgi:hypothetical protein